MDQYTRSRLEQGYTRYRINENYTNLRIHQRPSICNYAKETTDSGKCSIGPPSPFPTIIRVQPALRCSGYQPRSQRLRGHALKLGVTKKKLNRPRTSASEDRIQLQGGNEPSLWSGGGEDLKRCSDGGTGSGTIPTAARPDAEGSTSRLVVPTCRPDLSSKDSVASERVEQHQRKNEETRAPEYEGKTGIRCGGFVDGDGTGNHVGPEGDR
jgi:hypothetical protein